MIFKIFSVCLEFLGNPKKLALLNSIFIVLMVLGNFYAQALCIPSTWAAWLVAVCFAHTAFSPLLQPKTMFAPLNGILNGLSAAFFIYCVLFLGNVVLLAWISILHPALWGGLLVYVPYFFIIQLFWSNCVKPNSKVASFFFITTLTVCFAITYKVGKDYEMALQDIEKFKNSNYTQLERNFYTEKILGMHFLYHTDFCYLDGWRPPLHEPFLVIGHWWNGKKDPLKMPLRERLGLYKQFFPEKPFKLDCSCAYSYSRNYHNDPLWR
jgi:hypothetical protein